MREIVLVTGPPAAGKTTYVMRQAPPGAEVVDYDAIARDLGSPDGWDHPPHIREAARREVERRISQIAASGAPAYVIRSAPDPVERKRLADRIGATRIVVLNVPADVAKMRAAADGRPDWTAAAIDRWHARFRPSNDPREQAPDFLGTGGRFPMSDNAPATDAANSAPATDSAGATPDPTPQPSPTPPQDSPKAAKAPTWDGEFNPERAAQLVANLRAEVAELKGKFHAARMEALIATTARRHGIPDDLTDLIHGSTPEEVEAKAAKLAARLIPPAPEPMPPGRPKPRLVPGHGRADDGVPDFDPVALAARL